MNHFSGKVAIVTGGASGIGAAIVKQLVEYGAEVIIADITEKGHEFSEQLNETRHATEFIKTDIRRAEDAQAMVALAEAKFGGLDILVNCAGIFPRYTLMETTSEVWDNIMDINLKGSFQSCQAAVPLLIQRGAGAIVNIGSLNAYGGAPNLTPYSISKGGLLTMTMNMARSLAPHKIRVNTVTPGWVASDGELELSRKEGKPDGWLEVAGKELPLGRIQTPNDIASAVVFLASENASMITGQDLRVDGGHGFHY